MNLLLVALLSFILGALVAWLVSSLRLRAGFVPPFLLKGLFDTLPDPVAILDPAGRFRYVNSAFEEETGVAASSALGKYPREVFLNLIIEENGVQSALAGHIFKKSPRQDDPNDLMFGERKVTYVPVRNLGGRVTEILVWIASIEEIQKLNNAIRRQSEIIETMEDAIVIIDMDYRITGWNRGAELLYGYNAEEAMGKVMQDLLRSRLSPEAIKEGAQIIATQGILRRHDTRQHKDGHLIDMKSTVFPLRAPDGKQIGTVGIHRDITEYKHAQEALLESEGRFSTVADLAPVMIWESDPHGYCTFVNKPWLQFTGRTLEQELGAGWQETIHPDDRAIFKEVRDSAFARRQPFQVEYRVHGAQGEYRWLVNSGVPRYKADGTFMGYIGSCLDITERKQAEKLALEHNMEDERTRLLRKFVSDVSHDLRTPMAVLTSAVYILEKYIEKLLAQATAIVVNVSEQPDSNPTDPNCPDVPTQIKNLNETAQAINKRGQTMKEYVFKLQGQIDQMLEAVRLENKTDFEFAMRDLNTLVIRLANQCRAEADQKNIALNIELDRTLPLVNVDEREIIRALRNLVDNALQFTPKNGQVTVKLIHVSRQAVVEVRDTGIGIGPDDLPYIFDRFFRTDRARNPETGGSGLGLAIVKRIVEHHKGQVEVESTPNRGSCFRVILPLQ